jgi:[ribosomal protein S5]-alanine N-acetyltransferase
MVKTVNSQNPFNINLRTKRLNLRRVKESDDRDMFEYTSNPDVSRFLSWDPHIQITQTQEYIARLIEDYNLNNCYAWAIELSEIGKFIGIVRIFDVSFANKRGELSYILNPVFQGKGLIVEAIKVVIEFCFIEVDLNRIQARCTPDNYSSERVIQKVGMAYEGTLREFWVNKGVFADAKIFALTATDYKNMTGKLQGK